MVAGVGRFVAGSDDGPGTVILGSEIDGALVVGRFAGGSDDGPRWDVVVVLDGLHVDDLVTVNRLIEPLVCLGDFADALMRVANEAHASTLPSSRNREIDWSLIL